MSDQVRAFDFTDYRAYIRHRVRAAPRNGHGQYARIAKHLSVQTSMLSQIMAGARELNAEGAALLCEYFGLNDLESDYFLALVQVERAGNQRLKKQLQRQLEAIRKKSSEIDKRIPKDRELDDAAKGIFYSQWYYSGIRLATALEDTRSIEAISQRLRLPMPLVARVVEFLVAHGLCVYKEGKLHYGPKSTHVGADSPLVSRHHMNWRTKAMENLEGLEPWELLFTSPVAVSRKSAGEIRKLLLGTIDEWAKIADRSESETLMCLNLDWVEID